MEEVRASGIWLLIKAGRAPNIYTQTHSVQTIWATTHHADRSLIQSAMEGTHSETPKFERGFHDYVLENRLELGLPITAVLPSWDSIAYPCPECTCARLIYCAQLNEITGGSASSIPSRFLQMILLVEADTARQYTPSDRSSAIHGLVEVWTLSAFTTIQSIRVDRYWFLNVWEIENRITYVQSLCQAWTCLLCK